LRVGKKSMGLRGIAGEEGKPERKTAANWWKPALGARRWETALG